MQVPEIPTDCGLLKLTFLAPQKEGRPIRKLQDKDSNCAAVDALHLLA
jgi:hypothetical protein